MSIRPRRPRPFEPVSRLPPRPPQKLLDAIAETCIEDLAQTPDAEVLAEYLNDGGTLEELQVLKQKMLEAVTPNLGGEGPPSKGKRSRQM